MRLESDALLGSCDPAGLGFETTEELELLDFTFGQDRALKALEFGLEVTGKGFNLFVAGIPGSGRTSTVLAEVRRRAKQDATPLEACYVNNFKEPRRPRLLRLPPGYSRKLADACKQLVRELQQALPKAFESEEFELKRRHHLERFQQQRTARYNDLERQVNMLDFALLRSPTSLGVAPMRDGEILTPEKFAQLSTEERQRYEARGPEVEKLVSKTVREIQRKEKELNEQLKALRLEVASEVIEGLMEPVKETFAEFADVVSYLEDFAEDVKANLDDFAPEASPVPAELQGLLKQERDFHRYEVNVLVDHSETKGAPVVFEDNPTYQNLIGRIEHKAQLGALKTDFTLIKPGALLRANGGYLVLRARDLLSAFYAWQALKRSLRSRRVKLEELGAQLGLISTVSLEPEPVPLECKVVLIGDPILYSLLHTYDPEFSSLFKVKADFEILLDRTPEHEHLYARYVATTCAKHRLLPFSAAAAARVIEYGSRRAGHQRKLVLQLARTEELVQEAAFWAQKAQKSLVEAEDVDLALAEARRRVCSLEDRLKELTLEGTLKIETEGERIGQVNGLAVSLLGDYSFGRPVRITARVHPGRAGVVNLEREAKLSGPIHDKGVLILSGFLTGRFGALTPLSISASLCFEQNYGEIDGDSASLAELYALLSALAEVPFKQSLAITGSINQHGEVQAVGGVTEKIEGFFELCKARGLTGAEGVIIPASNLPNLNLRREVVEAVERGEFALYAIEHADEGLPLVCGLQAGELQPDGAYPEDTLNARVLQRLQTFETLLARRRESESTEDEAR